MKEIAKMLKSLGPKYTLEWRWEYFIIPSMIMTLHYVNNDLQIHVKKEFQIPDDQIEHMNEYGPQILDDMHRAIRERFRRLG